MCSSVNDNLASHQVRLDARLLAEIVDLIVAAVPTAAIYLFGSHARGEANESSDIDLYVVTSDEKKSPIRYATEARNAVFDRIYREGYDFDLISRSQNAFESARKKHFNVEYYVVQDGVKLYG